MYLGGDAMARPDRPAETAGQGMLAGPVLAASEESVHMARHIELHE